MLQKAVSLQQAWGDDFVSVEHLLSAVTQVATFTFKKETACTTPCVVTMRRCNSMLSGAAHRSYLDRKQLLLSVPVARKCMFLLQAEHVLQNAARMQVMNLPMSALASVDIIYPVALACVDDMCSGAARVPNVPGAISSECMPGAVQDPRLEGPLQQAGLDGGKVAAAVKVASRPTCPPLMACTLPAQNTPSGIG